MCSHIAFAHLLKGRISVCLVFNLTIMFLQSQNGAVSASRKQAIELTGGGVSSRRANLNWCQPLHFIPRAESRPIIALASFPGSGNTWLRYLLQQATGYTANLTSILCNSTTNGVLLLLTQTAPSRCGGDRGIRM